MGRLWGQRPIAAPWGVWMGIPRPCCRLGLGESPRLDGQHLLRGRSSISRQSWQALAGGGDGAAGKLGRFSLPCFSKCFSSLFFPFIFFFFFFLLRIQKLPRSSKRSSRDSGGVGVTWPPRFVLSCLPAPRPRRRPPRGSAWPELCWRGQEGARLSQAVFQVEWVPLFPAGARPARGSLPRQLPRAADVNPSRLRCLSQRCAPVTASGEASSTTPAPG